jgi:hypothetical protein
LGRGNNGAVTQGNSVVAAKGIPIARLLGFIRKRGPRGSRRLRGQLGLIKSIFPKLSLGNENRKSLGETMRLLP